MGALDGLVPRHYLSSGQGSSNRPGVTVLTTWGIDFGNGFSAYQREDIATEEKALKTLELMRKRTPNARLGKKVRTITVTDVETDWKDVTPD